MLHRSLPRARIKEGGASFSHLGVNARPCVCVGGGGGVACLPRSASTCESVIFCVSLGRMIINLPAI